MNRNLIFPSSGPFRILVLADIQESKPLTESYQRRILSVITQSKPNLIVLLGDMIFGPVMLTKKKVFSAIDSITDLLCRAGVPFTFVFGNHDLDSVLSSAKQLKQYKQSSLCLTPEPENRECPQAYSLDVLGDSENPVIRLLFFDSGATCLTRYGISYKGPCAQTDEWAQKMLTDYPIPSFAFQHVPVPSIYKLLSTEPGEVPGGVKGHGPYRKKWHTLLPDANGTLGESPCPEWQTIDHQLRAWSSSGTMKAAVFGHDHKNAFEGIVDGISLLQTPCAGLNCYGIDALRGVRLIDIEHDGSFSTHMQFYSH